jgi:hypothetical protein
LLGNWHDRLVGSVETCSIPGYGKAHRIVAQAS